MLVALFETWLTKNNTVCWKTRHFMNKRFKCYNVNCFITFNCGPLLKKTDLFEKKLQTSVKFEASPKHLRDRNALFPLDNVL